VVPPPPLGECQQIRVLVVEHKTILREGIGHLLHAEDDLTVAGMAEDGVTGLSMARELHPDVMVLELDLPKMSGLRVLELLDPASTSVRTLLFGASITANTAIEALELGARGVLAHDCSATALFKSIRSVAKGEYWVERALVGALARQVRLSSKPFGLTQREREVLSLVVLGYSNKEIAARCRVSSDTIKHHVTSIFDKTGASTRVELAVFALHHGLAGPESDESADPPDLTRAQPKVASILRAGRQPPGTTQQSA